MQKDYEKINSQKKDERERLKLAKERRREQQRKLWLLELIE